MAFHLSLRTFIVSRYDDLKALATLIISISTSFVLFLVKYITVTEYFLFQATRPFFLLTVSSAGQLNITCTSFSFCLHSCHSLCCLVPEPYFLGLCSLSHLLLVYGFPHYNLIDLECYHTLDVVFLVVTNRSICI